VLKCLKENVRRKRPHCQLWRNNSWFLHHDNVPDHASLLIHDFLANTNTTALLQPPYSSDLALADFLLLPKLKSILKGRCFPAIQEIMENSRIELCTILKKVYQDCFQKWQQLWEQCINAGREYLEGDKAHSVAGRFEKMIKK
jgi:hypothetical protein